MTYHTLTYTQTHTQLATSVDGYHHLYLGRQQRLAHCSSHVFLSYTRERLTGALCWGAHCRFGVGRERERMTERMGVLKEKQARTHAHMLI